MTASTLIHNRDHQQRLASQVNATLREAAKQRRENRKRQAGVETPSRKPAPRRMVQMPPSPAFGASPHTPRFVSQEHNGLTGAEKRRKRKGGNPKGGPGGGGIQGSMKRLKASLDKKDESLRRHRIGKGFA